MRNWKKSDGCYTSPNCQPKSGNRKAAIRQHLRQQALLSQWYLISRPIWLVKMRSLIFYSVTSYILPLGL